MKLPTFESYCDNTTKGNALVFTFGDIDVYYSYRTPVAFRADGRLVVRRNEWGPTTGKHLNAIDRGREDERVSGADFEEQLARLLDGVAPEDVGVDHTRCRECNNPDPSGHAARGMACPKCWEPIPTLDEKRERWYAQDDDATVAADALLDERKHERGRA